MQKPQRRVSKLIIFVAFASIIVYISLCVFVAYYKDSIAQVYTYAVRKQPNIREIANMYTNVPYCNTDNPAQQLDLFIPKTNATSAPLVIQIHGGGWRWGNKDNQIAERYAPQLVSRGIAVATVGYRLADEATYPAQNEDIECAIQYLRKNSTRLGIDSERIALLGDSAGGQLAAITALTSPSKYAIKGVVMLYGVTDIWQQITRFNDINAVYYLGARDKELAKQASPINADTANAPPFLIIHGTADTVVPADASEAFANKLKLNGSEATYLPIKGAGHAFIGGYDFREAYVFDTIIEFLVAKLSP